MQFQGLENPIQISLHHSHRLSGFVPDVMNVKPSKGRILLTAVIGDSPSAPGRSGVFCEGLKPKVFAKGNPGNPGRLGMGLCSVDFCSSKHVSIILGYQGQTGVTFSSQSNVGTNVSGHLQEECVALTPCFQNAEPQLHWILTLGPWLGASLKNQSRGKQTSTYLPRSQDKPASWNFDSVTYVEMCVRVTTKSTLRTVVCGKKSQPEKKKDQSYELVLPQISSGR